MSNDAVIPAQSSQIQPAGHIQRSYRRVTIVWLLTLLSLYLFQEYFS